jgi:hypothetical protein
MPGLYLPYESFILNDGYLPRVCVACAGSVIRRFDNTLDLFFLYRFVRMTPDGPSVLDNIHHACHSASLHGLFFSMPCGRVGIFQLSKIFAERQGNYDVTESKRLLLP